MKSNTRVGSRRTNAPGVNGHQLAALAGLTLMLCASAAAVQPSDGAEDGDATGSTTMPSGDYNYAARLSSLQSQIAAQQALLEHLQAQARQGDAGVQGEKPADLPVSPGTAQSGAGGGESTAAASATAAATTLPTGPATVAAPAQEGPDRTRPTDNTGQPVSMPVSPAGLPDGRNMTTAQRQAYASGVSVWHDIENSMNAQRSIGIDLDPRYVMLGVQDMATRQPLKMSRDAIDNVNMTLNQMYLQKSREQLDMQKQQGSAYRIAFSKQKGAKSDAGSWYQVLSRGTGRNLRTTDTVSLLVTGSLPDGTVFDASGQNGQAKTAKVGALLPAVAIGLQKLAPGGHIKIVVPPEKGYGDNGLPPAIPGGATLIFDIQVTGLSQGEG